MKVKYSKKPKVVKFSEVKPGDCFTLDGEIFMKAHIFGETKANNFVNAAGLARGSLVWIGADRLVLPVQVECTVTDLEG